MSGGDRPRPQIEKENAMKMYHASNSDTQTLHNGISFAASKSEVRIFGSHFFKIELDWDAYKVADMELVERNDGEDRWVWREAETGIEIRTMANEWPGDVMDRTQALIEAGFNACEFVDWDWDGVEIYTYRVLKLRAEDTGREMERID